MTGTRRTTIAIFGVLLVLFAGSALAWACTPQASISISPGTGAPGSRATVNGSAFQSGPVEIRWSSSTGTKLADTTGPNFSVPITIPDAPDDVYYVVAVSMGTQYKASAPFEVASGASAGNDQGQEDNGGTGSSSGSTSGSEGSTTSTGGSGSTSATASGGGGTQASSESGSASSGSASSGSSSSGSSQGSSSGATSARETSGAGSDRNGRSSTASSTRDRAASSNPLAVRTRSGEVVFGGSIGPRPARSVGSSGRGAPTKAVTVGEEPSEATVSSELWSGFSSDSSGSLIPALTDPVEANAQTRSELTLGLTLFGAGLVALSGASLVAITRRRRATAQTGPR